MWKSLFLAYAVNELPLNVLESIFQLLFRMRPHRGAVFKAGLTYATNSLKSVLVFQAGKGEELDRILYMRGKLSWQCTHQNIGCNISDSEVMHGVRPISS